MRVVAALVVAIAAVACRGGDGDPPADDTSGDVSETVTDDDAADDEAVAGDDGGAAADPSDDAAAEDAAGDDATSGSASGGGAAISVDDVNWSFSGIECYFAEDLEGDEEFVLYAEDDGIMLYVSIDGGGHYLELNDLDDPDTPRVEWYTTPDAPEFITVSGTGVVANTQVTGFDADGAVLAADARLMANCPG